MPEPSFSVSMSGYSSFILALTGVNDQVQQYNGKPQLISYKDKSSVMPITSMNGKQSAEIAVIEQLSRCSPCKNPTPAQAGVVVTATGRSTKTIIGKHRRIRDIDRVDLFFDLTCQVIFERFDPFLSIARSFTS